MMVGPTEVAPSHADGPLASSPWHRARPDAAACLLLVALCLAFFWPVFTGYRLVPLDGVYLIDQAFAPDRPTSLHLPFNATLTPDQVDVLFVWRGYAHTTLRAGFLPLWNPYAGGGFPLLANGQSSLTNPANLALNLALPAAAAQTAFALLSLLAAALFTYALVRTLGGTPLGGLLAGLSFAFGGFMLPWLGYPLAAAAAWLPALLLATHCFLRRPSLRWFLLLAACLGGQFLSGHPSTSAQLLVFWAVFIAYELHRYRRPVREAALALGLLVLTVCFGLALSASTLLPFAECLPLSEAGATGGRVHHRQLPLRATLRNVVLGERGFMKGIARGDLLLLFAPERHGNPAFGDYQPRANYGGYVERSDYTGVAALTVLLGSLLWWPRPGHRRFLVLAAFLTLATFLHLPLGHGLSLLPVLRATNLLRLRFIFTLCAAVALGLTASDWSRPSDDPAADRRPFWLAALGVALFSGWVAHATLPRLSPHFPSMPESDVWLRLVKLGAPAAAAAGLAVLLLLRARHRMRGPAFAGALLVLVVADMWCFAARWHALARPGVLPEPARATLTKRLTGLSRFSAPPDMLSPNIATAYGLYDARLYDPLQLRRPTRLAQALAGRASQDASALVMGADRPSPALYRLTSVSHYWAGGPANWELRPVAGALPRAYVTTAGRAATPDQALAGLAGGADPRRVTFIEGSRARPADRPGPLHPAHITSYEPNRVTLSAVTATPGWLVLTDTAYPGWQATVNGRPAPIVVANYAFRAVPLPAGTSSVVFTYRPASYRVGLYLSLLALALLVALLTAQGVSARRCR